MIQIIFQVNQTGKLLLKSKGDIQKQNNNYPNQVSRNSIPFLFKILPSQLLMKQLYSNKILPLTVKQLKKAELDYRYRKSQIFQMATYQFITIVARVIKLTSQEIKLTDQTEILDVEFLKSALRNACDPLAGKYYKISFFPKRNQFISNSPNFIAFQIVGMMRVNPNEITNHLMTCMQEKMERQNSSLNLKTKDQFTRTEISKSQTVISSSSPSKTNSASNSSSKKINGEYEISKYCRQLGAQFDVESIVNNFGNKFSIKDVQNVLEKLSEKGCIMDLGIVYEWVGEEE